VRTADDVSLEFISGSFQPASRPAGGRLQSAAPLDIVMIP
jgi:hypothetical protein